MAHGDIAITLAGRGYALRPTFGAAREIERRTDFALAELCQVHRAGRLKYEEAATIIWAGAEAAGERFNVDDVAEAVFMVRITDPALREAIGLFLLALLWSPETARKKWLEETGAADPTG
ncbi:gene transfer agent family protein [Paroceanicella profunda]|uniref:Gene transfer agent family protein n=1 Tax=Paroceanicella profunda TaxID=2579971 RepID=A0A5B8FGX1_9RHOB|nr:GTA-gp10 family protein [Paroceanicella profunda]QDL91497.1 gene transfer agent family protein [Paroceanicella profunda]QDL92548.1 gene transfer agent family protein [Paroceanicella profunda]